MPRRGGWPCATTASLALALARQNIAVQVYETLPELSHEARASTFHPGTLEMFAEWSVLDELLQRGYKVDRLQYWERRTRQLVAEFEYATIAPDTPYPFRLQCPQSILTRTLKPIVEGHSCAQIHMNHTLIDYKDCGTHVEALFQSPNGETLVKGAFLCGTDGSRSTVRRVAGIEFVGKTYEDRFLRVASDIDFQNLFPNFGPVCYVFDPTEWVIAMHLPDVTRVVFRLREDEDEEAAKQEEGVRVRMTQFTEQNLSYCIKGVSIYKVHQRVAETFWRNRVLLLGDAAHVNNPMGGMGMNSGIHDAYHLVPLLIDALHTGDVSELERYNTARRAYALNDVQLKTDKNYQDMASQDESYTGQLDFEEVTPPTYAKELSAARSGDPRARSGMAPPESAGHFAKIESAVANGGLCAAV